MWKLNQPSTNELDEYTRMLLTPLIKAIKENGIYIDVLLPTTEDGAEDNSILIKLLTLKPKQLFGLQCKLMKKIISEYGTSKLIKYLNIKNKIAKNPNLTPSEIIINNKYHKALTDLDEIFDYNKYISGSKSKSYRIAKIKGRNSCTYCNRQYTLTITKNSGSNDRDRISRPQLDHWFSKELYPLMSLSFYNLIPSCSICNSSIKGSEVFNLSQHVHPYLTQNLDSLFKFYPIKDVGNKYTVGVDESTCDARMKKTLNVFHIKDVYQFHAELELQDIMDFAIGTNSTYLETLYNQVLMKFPYKTPEDVYRMLFGTEMDNDRFLDRPMSKFKKDILTKIGLINP